MKQSFVLLAWVLFSALTLSAQDRSIDIRTLPHIDISGHAEAKVQPDTFEISVVFGETKEFFGKQNIEKLEQQIVDVLKGSGFDIQKDVKVTASYNVAEGKTVFIRKRIAFSVHSYAQYYDIAKQLDFKGVENVSITKASYSGEEALKSKLRAKALSDALHSAQDILDCYAEARKAGHDDINMDLIAGLPGDTVESFEHSLRQAIALDPENITVHTLTLKRASRIVIEDQRENDYADVAAMLEKCRLLAEAGYRPYYLYRQKYMSGSFENVGWCLPGTRCDYNIIMMEELQSVLSLGAGGITKLVNPDTGKITRLSNPKYPKEYLESADKRAQHIRQAVRFQRALPL